jgi:chromosome segregation ATPase
VAERGLTSGALAPLVADCERLAATCRELGAELERERAARRASERDRDGLLVELARLRRAGSAAPPPLAEIAEQREQRRALERDLADRAAALAGLEARCAALEAALAEARGEIAIGDEERACLEEQIGHLARALALLTAENRLLRLRRPDGGGAAGP